MMKDNQTQNVKQQLSCFQKFTNSISNCLKGSNKEEKNQKIKNVQNYQLNQQNANSASHLKKDQQNKQMKIKQQKLNKKNSAISQSQTIKSSQKNQQNKWEPRFQYIYVNPPKNRDKTKGAISKKDSERILNWVGQVCRNVFSASFKLLQIGALQQNLVKAYCSQNILRNFINLSKQYTINQKLVKDINDSMSKQILPYALKKYPQTIEKGVNKKFQSLLIERDSFEDMENDQVYKSKVKFQLKQDGNYNGQIMKFFNYILKLPENQQFQNISTKSIIQLMIPQQRNTIERNTLEKNFFQKKKAEQNKTLYKQFYSDMEQFFSLVETQANLQQIKYYDPRNTEKQGQIVSYFQRKQQNLQKVQAKEKAYKQKVKGYTHYKIGRKLAEHIETFSEKDIQMETLTLSNSAFMRVAIKWCQQLRNYFNDGYVEKRELPFRMKDGSLKYFRTIQLVALNYYLQFEWKKINNKLKEIIKNNYEQQAQFLNEQIDPKLKKLSKQQVIVGQFCSAVFKINQNYIINYLNLLIHGINQAAANFQKFQRYYSSTYSLTMQKLQQWIQSETVAKQISDLVEEQQLVQSKQEITPQLITFKVGDLMRCKCESKEYQISGLYKYLQKISKEKPQKMKIIRVKNRLDKGNKDILVNIMYRNIVLIEMQLVIKSQKSKFIDSSGKFNHYIYELQRAQFGPTLEMCSIWMSQDIRANYYTSLMQKNNVRHPSQRKQKQCKCPQQNKQIMMFPFRCSDCDCFYYDCTIVEKHIHCLSCKKSLCFLCQFQSANPEKKMKLLPCLSPINKQDLQKGCKQQTSIPENGGLLINLKAKVKRLIKFRTIISNNQYYLFDASPYEKQSYKQGKLKLIKKYAKKQFTNKQLKQQLVLSSKQIVKQIPQIDEQITYKQYFNPQYFITNYKKQNKSINVANRYLQNQDLQLPKFEKYIWRQVNHINFSDNYLKQIDEPMVNKFPNVEMALLQGNNIHLITPLSKNWKNLKVLNLYANQINDITNICEIETLNQLILQNNKIEKIPPNIEKLNQLQKLNLAVNSIQQLPQNLKKLIKLARLQLGFNKLKQLPKWISEFKNLSFLDLTSNNLTQLTPQIGKLTKLQRCMLSRNNFKSIPKQFFNLSNLQFLQLYSLKISNLPKQIKNLTKLKNLHLGYNRHLNTLPQQLFNLKNLTTLNLDDNDIVSLPQNMGNLKQLNLLNLSDNNITILPNSFTNLTNLSLLDLSQNTNLTQLPAGFSKLSSLTKLNLAKNPKLIKLPKDFGDLANLSDLALVDTSLTQLPQSFGNLRNLSLLAIIINPNLRQLPSSFGNLKNITKLYLNKNNLISIPKEMGNFKKLKQLDLQGNINLTSFPSQLGNLTNLDYLNLSQTNLKQIPPWIKNLTNLYILYLYNNNITIVPNYLFDLKYLAYLKLNNNKITTIPKQIQKLQKLLHLDVSNNFLKQLPYQIFDLQQLNDLNISNNINIQNLQQWLHHLQDLTRLTQLNLSNTNLKEFPQDLLDLTHLNKLCLSNNNIKIIPKQIDNLSKLTCLQLQNINITQLPQQFYQLTNLKQLNLAKNNVQVDFFSLMNFQQLRKLNLSFNNKLNSLDLKNLNCEDLTELQFQGNNISVLPSQIKNYDQLTFLNIANNNIKMLPQNFCELDQLKQLKIDENLLSIIQAWRLQGKLPQLEKINDRKLESLRTSIIMPNNNSQINPQSIVIYNNIKQNEVVAADRSSVVQKKRSPFSGMF